MKTKLKSVLHQNKVFNTYMLAIVHTSQSVLHQSKCLTPNHLFASI